MSLLPINTVVVVASLWGSVTEGSLFRAEEPSIFPSAIVCFDYSSLSVFAKQKQKKWKRPNIRSHPRTAVAWRSNTLVGRSMDIKKSFRGRKY